MNSQSAILLLIVIPLFICSIGCKKNEGCINVQAANYNADAKADDGTCQYNLLLWTNRAHAPINIYIDSIFQDSLVNHRMDTAVSCQDSDNLFRTTLSPGNYVLYAKMDPFIEWIDTIRIDANCQKIKLEVP